MAGDLALGVDFPRNTLLDAILSQQKQPLSEVVSRVTYVARFCDQATAQSATRTYGADSQFCSLYLDVGRVHDRTDQCR